MSDWDSVDDTLRQVLTNTTAAIEKLDAVLARLGEAPGQPTEPDPGQPGEPTEPAPSKGRPVDIVPIFADYTITLPVNKPGATNSPWNDYPDKMTDGQAPGMFYAGTYSGRRCVVFEVSNPSKAATTANSNYPRSEARGMKRGQRWEEIAYPATRPTVITAEVAILTDKLVTRKRISGVQTHGGGDDVWQLIADEQGRLGISYDDGDGWLNLRDGYRGEWVRFVARNDSKGFCSFELDGVAVPGGFTAKGSGWYPKVGAYLQTGGKSTKHVEPAHAVGRVMVASFTVNPID